MCHLLLMIKYLKGTRECAFVNGVFDFRHLSSSCECASCHGACDCCGMHVAYIGIQYGKYLNVSVRNYFGRVHHTCLYL